MDTEILASWTDIGLAVASTAATFLAIITYTRVVGLRSFSKMSSFDFAMTVAIGSTMASTGLGGSSLLVGLSVLATLYVVQYVIALARRRSTLVHSAVDNTPVLLMTGGHVFEDALAATRVTRTDIVAKLREANVLRLQDVHAVVLETTGDISVLHGEPDARFDADALLDGVRGGDRLGRA